jgi:hypothetical protein
VFVDSNVMVSAILSETSVETVKKRWMKLLEKLRIECKKIL